MSIKIKSIPKSKCLECKKYLWDELPSRPPDIGGLVVCVFCGHMMEFGNKLQLIKTKKIHEEAKEASLIIKILNALKSNPFNNDPDRFNVQKLLMPTH